MSQPGKSRAGRRRGGTQEMVATGRKSRGPTRGLRSHRHENRRGEERVRSRRLRPLRICQQGLVAKGRPHRRNPAGPAFPMIRLASRAPGLPHRGGHSLPFCVVLARVHGFSQVQRKPWTNPHWGTLHRVTDHSAQCQGQDKKGPGHRHDRPDSGDSAAGCDGVSRAGSPARREGVSERAVTVRQGRRGDGLGLPGVSSRARARGPGHGPGREGTVRV